MNINDLKAQFRSGTIGKADFIDRALTECHSRLFDYVDITRSTDVRRILIDGDGVSFVIGDEAIRMFAPPAEARVAPLEIMNFDRYEPDETKVMDILSAGARTVLDVGANIGWYSIRFARRSPGLRVFAFEPMPASFTYLQRNIAANAVGHAVTALNYGLADTSGIVKFYLSPAAGTNASLRNVANSASAVEVEAPTLTLDGWCRSFGVVPDFIKCDVEGAELLVFRGARGTLADHAPVLFAEVLRKWAKPFGYHPNDLIGYLGTLGYRCFAVGAGTVRTLTEVTEETPETNYAFLHRERHAGLIGAMEQLS